MQWIWKHGERMFRILMRTRRNAPGRANESIADSLSAQNGPSFPKLVKLIVPVQEPNLGRLKGNNSLKSLIPQESFQLSIQPINSPRSIRRSRTAQGKVSVFDYLWMELIQLSGTRKTNPITPFTITLPGKTRVLRKMI